MQQTLKRDVNLVGTGLHSGRPARLCIKPAAQGSGICFLRTDLAADGESPLIEARWDNVSDTVLNTRVTNAGGVSVSTIEHLMAALFGCGVHNACIEIDGPEVPIFDGSSRRIAKAILAAGIAVQAAPLRFIRILDEIRVGRGDAFASLGPADGCIIDYSIAFDEKAIGQQALRLDICNGAFLRELADCRTFCRQSDVEQLRSQGLALGGTLENALVVDGENILTPGGFRREDECVRHKMLDAMGDLGLAGAPILGVYKGHKAGHALTNQLLRALFAREDAWRFEEASPEVAARLPGMELKPQDMSAVG